MPGGQWQKWIAIGNLVRDPQKGVYDGNKPRTTFTVAVGRSYRLGTEIRQKVFYAKCVAFGHEANYVAKYAKKGTAVYVVGEVYEHPWTDKDGGKHSSTVIEVDEVSLLGEVEPAAPQPAPLDPGLPEGF